MLQERDLFLSHSTISAIKANLISEGQSFLRNGPQAAEQVPQEQRAIGRLPHHLPL